MLTRLSATTVLASALLAFSGPFADAALAAEVPPVRFFDLSEVQLLGGPFQTAMELNLKYLLSLEPDRFLAGVRRNAGLEPKARRYGGWEAQGVAGQSLGHYMTALAQQYRATSDEEFKKRLDYIVDELALCQDQDATGYVAAIPNGKEEFEGLKARGGRLLGWVPWYTMHKLFQGLRDAHRYCGNEKAKVVLLRLADWADSVTKELTETEKEVMLGHEHGGMNETLADVYALTGDPRHLAVAKRFCHRVVMDPLAKGEDRLDGLHANTQVPKIVGAARLYELTGDEYFHDVAENFWNIVVGERSFVIGGNSDREHFFPPEEHRHHLSTATAETCNTYNMLRLTTHLAQWEPDGRWMDYYERALYNQILASQDPKTGMFTYFIAMKPGHFKIYSHPTNAFWCCVGTGMENHTKYSAAIYAHSDDALLVNLFIPSEVKWSDKGVTLRQETEFPESDTTRLTIACDESVSFALKIRSPFWLRSPMEIEVNSEKVDAPVEGGFAAIQRVWRCGDVVSVQLPMGLRTETLRHTPDIVSVLYGPIVLAAELGREGMEELNLYQDNHNQNIYRNVPVPVTPVFVTDAQDMLSRIEPVTDKPLTFRTRNLTRPEDVTLIPFYRMHHQRYAVYFEKFTTAGWDERKVELRLAEQRRKAFEARIVDDVRPGEQQSEVDHVFRGLRSFSGGSTPKWRDARDGGWFEYTVQVDPNAPMEVQATYWGSDGGNRRFDILVDGELFATEALTANKPNEHFEKTYPIATELTRGKKQVVLRFQAKPDSVAGGIFGVRLIRQEVKQ